MKRIQKLEMLGISKSFHGFYANKNINLTIETGKVLGLLGENGAGKTTLMNILYGLYIPDSGEIKINGKTVNIKSPRDSISLGIGMVHQHFMLVQNHTVAENIALGSDSSFFYPLKSIKRKIKQFSSKYKLNVDPDKKIWELSAGEQQRVEIIKTLMRGADLLIMDEPTSVLTPRETEELFEIINQMKSEGHSVILISHKLEEILSVCDNVVVLKKGETSGSKKSLENTSKSELAKMMVGRDVIFNFEKKKLPKGECVLDVENLKVEGDRGLVSVNNISFKVYKNEIFGIAGVSGNGQRELVEAITGLRKAESGRIMIHGKDITNESARVINNSGISHVPEERIKFGIVPNLLIYENAVLKHHHSKPFSNIMFLDYNEIKGHANNIINNYKVSVPSINMQMKNLSGGNIQKVILGREIERKPELLVASHPTYGLDVGATEYIREQLLKQRESGGSVLLVSEDLEEIFEVCDRIAVIFKGEFMDIVDAENVDMNKIGLLMAGSKNE